jgi:uncharacterized protein YqeY
MIQIDELIKDSLKNKKTVELKVYRNLKADIMAFKTQKNAPEFTEAVFYSIINKYIKKMEDAEKQYFQAGREDLSSECREESEVLRKLLPEPVTSQEILDLVTSTALDRNWVNGEKIAIPKKEMGNFIKQIKTVFPTADGKMISDIIKANLE